MNNYITYRHVVSEGNLLRMSSHRGEIFVKNLLDDAIIYWGGISSGLFVPYNITVEEYAKGVLLIQIIGLSPDALPETYPMSSYRQLLRTLIRFLNYKIGSIDSSHTLISFGKEYISEEKVDIG